MDSLDRSRSVAALARIERVFNHPASRLAALPAVAFAVVWRDPSLFKSPRLWADEGTNYLASALRGRWFEALADLRATPYASYLNPVPHLATFVAARFGRLESTPVVTTTVWCLFFGALELCVLYGRAPVLGGPFRRALALVVPLVATNNGENWVNTVGVHYVCDLVVLLLLLEAPHVSGRRRTASVAATGFFAAASQTNWFLLPTAALLYRRDHDGYKPYLRVLALAAFVHLAAAFALHMAGVRSANDFVAVPHVLFVKFVVWPFAGWDRADGYGAFALGLDPASFAVSAVVLALNLVALGIVAFRTIRRDAVTIALASAYVAFIVGYAFLGLDVGRGHLATFNGGRYAWLPNSIALLLIGHQIDFSRRRVSDLRNASFSALLAAGLLVGVVDYRHPKAAHGPSWRREVRHFRRDPGYHKLRIAPAGWVVDVPQDLR